MADEITDAVTDETTNPADATNTTDDNTALANTNYTGPIQYQSGESTGETALSTSTPTTGITQATGESIASYSSPDANIASINVPGSQTDDEGNILTSSYYTPETKVANQLEALLNKDSAISQQQRVAARNQAAALGMTSSASAIGQTNARNVAALTSVAKQDAETAMKFNLQQQQAENEAYNVQVEGEVSGALQVQKADITERQENINRQWETLFKEVDQDNQYELNVLQGQINDQAKKLEGDLSLELQQLDVDANIKQAVLNNSAQAIADYHVSIQQLLSSDGFLDNFGGDKAAMYGYFNDMFTQVESSIKLQAKTAGIYDTEFQSYIDEMVASNQWDIG